MKIFLLELIFNNKIKKKNQDFPSFSFQASKSYIFLSLFLTFSIKSSKKKKIFCLPIFINNQYDN